MNAKTILVTGGAGFIGSNLIDKLLELGYIIICLDNFDEFYPKEIKIRNLSGAIKNKNFTLIEGDINNLNDIESCFKNYKIDFVIHLAAKAGVRPSIDDPLNCYQTNIFGTLNLLEIMKKYKVDKLVFASSSSVYGNNKILPFSESDYVDSPISPYAASKRSGELLCHTYHQLYNFDIFCLRFFTVYGPRQRPDLAIHKFTNLILQGQEVPFYGDGLTARDYTYIDDIIDGILGAIYNLKGFNIFNLGESRTITLKKMIEVLESKMHKNIKIKLLPMQSGDVDITFANIKKATNLLGYEPKWAFENGIDEFLKWKMEITN
jgi:UDP-glucuronate 4-epimerase